ncbi:MAG TPA: transcription elongation factor GreA [Candidatus Eremiobacteraceae bacterium]|nr:transcription elongation factor GreA [Candidatus Eremiobacteraceae bacterium]
MTEKEVLLTEDGLRKLEAELDELKSVHRKEVNDRIRQAKEFGDISENAEYEDAKQEQAFVEGRILKLEAMIRNAKIIVEGEGGADEVHLGSTVRVRNVTAGTESEYTIVGSTESDPLNAKISNESPIGVALIGSKPGATVTASTPGGEVQLKVISIRGNRRASSKTKAK